jgi:DNA repair protein RecO (recombination protein O)
MASSKHRLYRLEGLVLGRRNQGEADRVIRLLTLDGWTDLLAKGVRKPRSRKAGHLELFSRTRVLVSRVKNSWDIISQAEAEVVRTGLQEDFQRATYARYIAELVIRFFQGEIERELYDLVDQTLAGMEAVPDPELLVRWFEQHLLVLAGFRPTWETCVGEKGAELCRAPLHPRPQDRRPYGVDPERGGALCGDCFTASRGLRGGVRPLSPSALSWLQALQRRPYEAVQQFDLPPQTRGELAHVMDHYIAYHLERRPSVARLMREGG